MKYSIKYDDSTGNRRFLTVSKDKPKLYDTIKQAEADVEKFVDIFDNMSIEEVADIDETEN